MRKSLVVLLLLSVFITIISMVACNSDIPTETSSAMVTFAPSVPKALNQDGKSQVVSAQVTDYKWQYVCSEQDFSLSDNLDWRNFFDDFDSTSPTNGLGNIKNLEKNHDYFFALRAYSDSELVWEGKTPSAARLATRITTVTITVYPVGQTNIYFNITAPVASDWNTSPSDRFVISWSAMGDSSTSGTNSYLATLNDDEDEYTLNNLSGEPILLKAGTYLFTVKQQTYNPDDKEYEDVTGRKQVLIVDAQSGVDTVIYGALDSTGIVALTYDGKFYIDSDGNRYGIEIDHWISSDEDISTLPVIVYNSENPEEEKYVRKYDTIFVREGEYLHIDFSSASDNWDIYVNGDKVLSNTNIVDPSITGKSFYKKAITDPEANECSYLYDIEGKTIKAYGKKDVDYLVSIVSRTDKKSMTFTIMSRTELEDTSMATGEFAESELTSGTSITLRHVIRAMDPGDIEVTATMLANDAKEILVNMLQSANKYDETNAANNYITLTLYVTEKEVTKIRAEYDIWLEAFVKIKNGESIIYKSAAQRINSVNDYVYVNMKIQPYLKDMTMTHGADKKVMTSCTNIKKTNPADDPENAGFYCYNPEVVPLPENCSEEKKAEIDAKYAKLSYDKKKDSVNGVLDIKTKSFSPFVSKYKSAGICSVDFYLPVGDVYGMVDETIQAIEGYVIPYKEVVNKSGNKVLWKVGPEEDARIWDFDKDLVTGDMSLYGYFETKKVNFYNGSTLLETITYNYLDSITRTPTVEVPTGKQIVGWNYSEDGTGAYFDFINGKVKDNFNLYVQIQPVYELEFVNTMAWGIGDPFYVGVSGLSWLKDELDDLGRLKHCITGTYYPEDTKVTMLDSTDSKYDYKVLRTTSVSGFSYDYALVAPNPVKEVRIYKNYDTMKTIEANTDKVLVATLKPGDDSSYVTDKTSAFVLPIYDVTLTLNPNYPGSSATNVTLPAYGREIPSDSVTRPGYTISDWYEDAECTGAKWVSTTDLLLDNFTLYAKWEIVDYSISYELNGGTISGTAPSTYNIGDIITLPNAYKEGQAFVGWFDSATGGKLVPYLTSTDYGNKTLYARYEDFDASKNTLQMTYGPKGQWGMANFCKWRVSATKTWNGRIEYCLTTSTDATVRAQQLNSPWTVWNGEPIVVEGYNDILYFRGVGNTIISNGSPWVFEEWSASYLEWSKMSLTSAVQCVLLKGNLMNLMDWTENWNNPDSVSIEMEEHCFDAMFKNAGVNVDNDGDITLPATKLSKYCYYEMFMNDGAFWGKKPIITLPATTLKEYCYAKMFYCEPNLFSGMKGTPSIPASEFPAYSCYQMFYGGYNILGQEVGLIGPSTGTITSLGDYSMYMLFAYCEGTNFYETYGTRVFAFPSADKFGTDAVKDMFYLTYFATHKNFQGETRTEHVAGKTFCQGAWDSPSQM